MRSQIIALCLAALKDVGDEAPPDGDLPVAWIKTYGEGRVFASTLGHTREAFRDPDIARMYTQAIAWSLGLIDGPPPTPHPKNFKQKAGQ
jgi:type 1 glutamine amidotransferase